MKLHQLTLSKDIVLSGNKKQIAKAEGRLNPIISFISQLPEKEARIFLQDAIDEYRLYANIVYRGHVVWSRKRITRNLERVVKRGQLYDNKRNIRVQWVRMGAMACLPKVEKNFKPLLNEYFYDFLVACCGSDPHYNRIGWIGIYPTLDDLKRFFTANEHNKPVSVYVPAWKSDVARIVEDIERMLIPFRSYIKAKQKEDEERKR